VVHAFSGTGRVLLNAPLRSAPSCLRDTPQKHAAQERATPRFIFVGDEEKKERLKDD
jgi:hypothetical protein